MQRELLYFMLSCGDGNRDVGNITRHHINDLKDSSWMCYRINNPFNRIWHKPLIAAAIGLLFLAVTAATNCVQTVYVKKA